MSKYDEEQEYAKKLGQILSKGLEESFSTHMRHMEEMYASRKDLLNEARNKKNELDSRYGNKDLLDELEKAKDALNNAREEYRNGNKTKEEVEKLADAYNELSKDAKDYGTALKYINENSGFEGALNGANRLSKRITEITSSLKAIDSDLFNLVKPWAEADKAASKFTKTIGGTKAAMDALRKSTINNVVRGKLGIDYNVSSDELIGLQENYIKGVGRNIKLGNAEQENIAAMHAIYQGGEAEMATMFDKFGVGIEGTSKHLGKMFTDASKSGISLDKYADNVKKGLAMAQTYTFTGGLRSMERMAQRAAAIRMDMAQVQHMADSLDSVEKSITTAAKMQVLGGSFAAAADPLGMLRESLMDPEELQKRMESVTASIGTFNKATGEVEISAFDRMRLKEYANATGQDFGQLMEQTRRQAQMGEIRSQISSSTNATGLSDEMKKLIENTAIFQDGKAGVSINGEFRSIDSLSNDDYEELVKETQSESEDIKDIAKNLRSLVDIRQGTRKQFEANQAQMTGWLGKSMSFITDKVGNMNKLLKAIVLLWAGKTALSVFGHGRDILGSIVGRAKGGLGARRGTMGSANFISRISKKSGGKILGDASKVATKMSGGVIKGGVNQTAKRALIKAAGKQGATRILGAGAKIAAGAGKALSAGGPLGVIGAVGNIATDSLVNKGKIAKGGAAHAAMKVASQAATGAGIGAAIGSIIPGLGTAIGGAIGGAIGTAVGAFQIRKIRRGQIVDNQLGSMGIERKGKYSSEQLKDIDKALQTGKMSNQLRKKLLRQGDTDIVNKINEAKDREDIKKTDRKNKRREMFMNALSAGKQKFGTANFEVGVANFGGRGFGGVARGRMSPIGITRNVIGKAKDSAGRTISIIKGSKEVGLRASWEAVKSGESAFGKQRRKAAVASQGSNGNINVNINGTLRLEGGNGQSVDVLAEIKRNPALLSQLTDMIIKKMNTDTYGGYRSDRTLGNNIPA